MSEHKPHITPDPGNINCPGCSRYNIPEGCGSCHRCADCCGCTLCRECKVRHRPSRCPRCGECSRSGRCICHGKPGACNVEDLIPPRIFTSRDGSRVQIRKSGETGTFAADRAATVELELSNYNPEHRIRFVNTTARMTRDGSIRGNNPGELIVGPIPARNHSDVMEELGRWLAGDDPKGRHITTPAQTNTTCGMHVHVDARDFGAWELRRLTKLYQKLEGLFYSLVQPERQGNQYCHAFDPAIWRKLDRAWETSDSGEIRQRILTAIYATRGLTEMEAARAAQQYKGMRGNNHAVPARYNGLNIHSYFHRGTFEFRMHEGTVDIQRISDWMQFCRWTVELASRLTDSEIASIREPSDFTLGCWKRPYGLLSLPKECVAMVQRGRVVVLQVVPTADPPDGFAEPQITLQGIHNMLGNAPTWGRAEAAIPPRTARPRINWAERERATIDATQEAGAIVDLHAVTDRLMTNLRTQVRGEG